MDPPACEPDWVEVRDQLASSPQHRRAQEPATIDTAVGGDTGGRVQPVAKVGVQPVAKVGVQHSSLSNECMLQQDAPVDGVVLSQDWIAHSRRTSPTSPDDIGGKLDHQTFTADEVLHCENLRPFRVQDLTVCAVEPTGFQAPSVSTATIKGVCDTMATAKGVAAAFDKALKCSIHKCATDRPTKFRKLDLHEQVFLQGHYRRDGPCLWGQIRGGEWVLLCVELWPLWPQRPRSCWSYLCPMCHDGPLGTLDMVQDGLDCRRQASRELGPNLYCGYCELPHCI